MVTPRVVSQMLSRPRPLGSYDCGPCSVFAALYLSSGGAFRIGYRNRRASVIELIRTRGSMTDGPDGTSIEEQAAAFRAFAPEFAALGLGAPHMQAVRGGSFSGFHDKLAAGKWAIVSIGYGPIDAYLDHAISGTWCFDGNHAALTGDLRTEGGIEVVTLVDSLDDGRWSTSSHCTHSGYTPRGPVTIPYSLLRAAMEAYHDRGTATYGAFTAAGVVEDPDETDGSGSTGSDAPGESHSDYPGRGAWAFYNETRGFNFWPTLDSIAIQDGRPDDLATFSADVVDLDSSLVFGNEDVIQATFDGDYLFRGDLIVPGGSYRSAVGPRVWNLTGQDFTARLDDDPIEHGKRPKESARARIEWIMAQGTRGITYAHIDPPDVDVDKADLTGESLREALDNVAAEVRIHYYVDWDLDLRLFRTDAAAADYGLDDSAPDYSTTFPFWNYTVEPDSTDFHDRTFVQGDKPAHSAWEHDYSWSGPNDVPHASRVISDSTITSAAHASAAGQRDLDLAKSPVITGEFDIAQPGLIAGLTVHIAPALWPEREGDYILVSVSTTAIDAHDAGGVAALRIHATYRDRREHRGPKLHDQVNKLTRQRPEQSGPAEFCAGTPLAAIPNHAAASYENQGVSFLFGSSAAPEVVATVTGNSPWPGAGCPVGLGGWGPGVDTQEVWYQLVEWGDLADDDVGVLVEVVAVPDADLEGVAHTGMALLGVAYADPTAMGAFTVLGSFPLVAGGTIMVSRSLLDGATYLVVAPVWRALVGYFACAEDLYDGAHGPAMGGEGNSGKSVAPTLIVTVQSFCSSGRAEWVGGDGATDGSNATYRLIDWTGTGSVEARIGAMILGAGDFTADPDAGTVTLSQAPFLHANVAFRYDVEVA